MFTDSNAWKILLVEGSPGGVEYREYSEIDEKYEKSLKILKNLEILVVLVVVVPGEGPREP